MNCKTRRMSGGFCVLRGYYFENRFCPVSRFAFKVIARRRPFQNSIFSNRQTPYNPLFTSTICALSALAIFLEKSTHSL